MAVDIGYEGFYVILLLIITLYILHKYPRLTSSQMILMLIWIPIGIQYLNDLTVDGQAIYIGVAIFFLAEFMTLMLLIQNFQDGNGLLKHK